jgi:membrane protein DedA with SNARE-associated domain
MGITEYVAEWSTRVLEASGYAGLAFLMALESMIAPVPSEAVMPFAGFLVAEGKFTLHGAILASSLGTLMGSWAGYLMGACGGYPLVNRWGRYLLLDRSHLEWTAAWFAKRGNMTILVARFVPVVRHLISIPAGCARMDPWRFTFYTLLGGTAWNTFLLRVGIELRERWYLVERYTHQIDYVVLAALVLAGAWWAYRRLRTLRAGGTETGE